MSGCIDKQGLMRLENIELRAITMLTVLLLSQHIWHLGRGFLASLITLTSEIHPESFWGLELALCQRVRCKYNDIQSNYLTCGAPPASLLLRRCLLQVQLLQD